MTNHKTRPGLKKYAKQGIILNPAKQDKYLKRKQKHLFYHPDICYLSSRFSSKLEEYFSKSLSNKRKFKLIFGFHKTASLKRVLKKELFFATRSHRFIKEIELCSLLERRLDMLLFRLGFAATLFEAKHLISHKKIYVNQKLNTISSRLLNKGDVISLSSDVVDRVRFRVVDQSTKRSGFSIKFSNVEVNWQTLRVVVLQRKPDFFEQVLHYSLLINWKDLINE